MSRPRPTMTLSIPLALVALVGLHGVSAQITSNATCLSNWQDLYNSKGQSPCLVGAYLGGACNGGQYDVSALNSGEHYIGPLTSNANDCLCSTVMYNMMAGCSTCQNATIITWSSWTAVCPQVYVDTFPEDIPQDTAVPGWAYEDFTNSTFNPSQALQDSTPESTATRQQTTNSATSSDSSASATASSGVSGDSTSSSSSSSSSSKSNTGAIAGGVVGGVVGVALLALLGFFLYRRNQKNAHKITPVNSAQANLTGGPSTFGGASGGGGGQYAPVPYTPNAYEHTGSSGAAGGGMGSPPPMAQQRLYDPNDPTTFPTSPLPGSIHDQNTGQSYTPSFSQQNTSGIPSQGPNQGMYRGVAEV